MISTRVQALLFSLLVFATVSAAQDKPAVDTPQDAKSLAPGVVERGNPAMGFDQNKTTHHFLLRDDGGVIQVTINHPSDVADLNMIRKHLAHIALAFSNGDFNIPMLVHDRVPPGVPVMKASKSKIHYRYEELDGGGRVVIESRDARAILAVHEFLRFQIREHATSDPLKID
ncbi:MAG: hypothetical protein ACRD50_08930 [Candidatus Acidiferrales bacterium]